MYHVTIQSSKSKPEHIKCLAKEMSNDNGAKLQGYYDSLPADRRRLLVMEITMMEIAMSRSEVRRRATMTDLTMEKSIVKSG